MQLQKNFAFYLTVVIFPLIIVALITAIILIKPTPKSPATPDTVPTSNSSSL